MRRKTTILTFLSLLLVIFSHAQVPSANFTAPITSGCSPLVVNFQDASTGSITSWFWDFGNGATSTLKNPSTTYFNPGVYTVTLTVANVQGSNTLTRTSLVTIFGKPSINFAASDSAGCFPLPVRFTDLSTPASGTVNNDWLWDFGDGSQTSQQNPTNVYRNAGNFTVTVKVTNDKGCYAVLSKPAYIRVTTGVQASFSNTMAAVCRAPFAITFNGAATGPGTLSYFWDFGDGTTSTLLNPTHNYTTPGNYTVSFATTSSVGCSDTVRKVSLLNIQNVNTAFTAPDSICVNSPINFVNTSTPAPAGANWNFGDGSSSTNIDPVKIYNTPGTYNISLVNNYGYCSDSFSKSIRILPRPVANFTADSLFKCSPSLNVQFTDASVNAVGWQWDFGDGSTSTQQNPRHLYNRFDSFDVRLIVTNIFGCTDTLVRRAYIKIIKPVISFPSLPQEGCIPFGITFSANITTLDNVTSYLWNFGDGTTSTATTPAHVYAAQGAYNVSLTITTSTGCTETVTMGGAVLVGRKPVINFSAVPNPACAFQQVQFNNLTTESDRWTWDFGDGGSSIQENPQHQYSDTGWFDVGLIATNFGCPDTLRINRYIRIKPPIARWGYYADCSSRLRFTFVDSSIGATSWFWEFGDGTTSTTQNPVHFFPGFGNYTVKLTVSNDTCQHSFTRPIRVFEENPAFVATDTVLCRVGQLQLRSSTNNPANIINYYWDLGNGGTLSNPGFSAINATYPASGLYTVTLITTDFYGCFDTVVKANYIRINGPTASFNATNTTGCKGLKTTFNDLSTGDGISPIVQWRWDFGDGTIQNFGSGPFEHTYATAGTFTVKLTITDAGGCRDSLSISNLVITTNPKALFVADSLACPGSVVSFTNQSLALNYVSEWSFGDGASSLINSPTHAYGDTGFYTIKLKVTDQYNCADSIIKPNYVRISRPVASYTISDSISSCAPFEVKFTNTSFYYSSYVWDLAGGISTIASPVQYYFNPGVYNTSLIVTSPGGCSDTAYKTLTVYDTAGTNLTYLPLNGCKPLTVDLKSFSKGPVTFTWDMGDGFIITTNADSLRHVYNYFGDFVPKVILTDPSGCVIPFTGLDTIRIIGTTAKFGLDKKFFCDSGRVQFIDSTTYNDSLVSYTWNFGDGTTSNLQSPSHNYSTPGLYTASLNLQTVNACVDTFSIVNAIKIVASPLITINGDSVICINEFINHRGVLQRTDTSAVQWRWQFPNSNNSNQQNPVPQQYRVAGSFVVNTIATNSSGCTDTATQNIVVNPLPVVSMPGTITKQAGFPVTIPATYSPNTATWSWTPNATLDCGNCPTPTTNTKFNAQYTVSFVDSNGCRNTGQVQVIVVCKNGNVFVPNTFSPNGDGNNEIFMVRGRGLERVKTLRIFNRWGEVVFEQMNFPVNDASHGWDGKHKGKPALPDVYVYQVEVFCENSEIIRFEGNVALIQ